jgi:hypothetical protein
MPKSTQGEAETLIMIWNDAGNKFPFHFYWVQHVAITTLNNKDYWRCVKKKERVYQKR